MNTQRKVKKVQARHILVADKELAEKLKKEIDEGADFSKIAEEHSECPSKKRGGDLGWFGKGAMARPFELAAFTAEEGEVVGPVKTEFGWHLIYVYEIQTDAKADAGPPTGDEGADESQCFSVAENYAHEFMMLGYSSKKVMSLFTSAHFKAANQVYVMLGKEKVQGVIDQVFGQNQGEAPEGEAAKQDDAPAT